MSEILDRYTFFPWVRRGLAAKIEETDNLDDFSSGVPPGGWATGRPQVEIKAKIEATKVGGGTDDKEVIQNVSLVGPGDVTSIDTKVVIKTEPKNWVTNFEPNYFPYIEFYEEDFPWRYSPASNNGLKLRPWLVLVTLKDGEYERDKALLGSLPSIRILGSESDQSGTTGAESQVFPSPANTWAWAHVHLNGGVEPSNYPSSSTSSSDAIDELQDKVNSNPDLAYSRMISARQLDANTKYHCFLLPAFETGRLAGLGAKEAVIDTHNAQESSFGAAHSTDADHLLYADRYPVYYEWEFMTGEEGDFESLVRKLQPIEVDPKVGRRPMDIQEPGFNIGYAANGDTAPDDGTILLEGVLLPPQTDDPPPDALPLYQHPWDSGTVTFNYRKRLADFLNLGEDLLEATFPPSSFAGTNPFGYTTGSTDVTDDPYVVPDIYGRWHALENTVNPTFFYYQRWLHELNLDPRNRAVAGMGVRYVKENQETLMDKAWDQLGDVIDANRKLKWGQMAKVVANAAYAKHVKTQPAEQFAGIVGKMFNRVKSGSTSARKAVVDSSLPQTTLGPGYRKAERPGGRIMRSIDSNQVIFKGNNLRKSLANGDLASVEALTVSTQMGRMDLTSIDQDVATISSYNVGAPIYNPTPPGSTVINATVQEEQIFKAAVSRYNDYFAVPNWPDVNAGSNISLASISADVDLAISPFTTIPAFVYSFINFSSLKGIKPPQPQKIVPVMAYPVFPEPMYEAVKNLSVDYLVPNLDLIPDNSVTLLESNQRFIEAFMVGLNHEMGRELLWREYMTDQRGSYFRQFWDSIDALQDPGDSDEDHAKNHLDIEEIHLWDASTPLGTHSPRPGAGTGMLVLVIRGDLLKKYPNTVIYAQKAKFQAGDTDHSLPRELDTEIRTPVFSAQVEPDIYFLGFQLEADEAKGDRDEGDPGWFFILQERPGEIRFGVDADSSSATPATWNDLSLGNAPFSEGHLNPNSNPNSPPDKTIYHQTMDWGTSSANMAQILFQEPVLLAIHADEMIK